jgi:hypothetical protein
VSGFRQKLNLISKRLIVGWAGSFVQAKSIMRDLKQLDKDSASLSFEIIQKVIDAVPEGDRDQISLIGSGLDFLDDGQITIHNFNYNASENMSFGAVDFVACGSGSSSLKSIMPTLLQHTFDRFENDRHDYATVRKIAHRIQGYLVGQEMFLTPTFTEWWGGGIEIATITPNGFEKIGGDTLFVFMEMARRKNGTVGINIFPKFYKYDYINDRLTIHVREVSLEKEGASLTRRECWCFSPLISDFTLSHNSLIEVDLKHQMLMCMLYGDTPDGRIFGLKCHFDINRESPLNVEITGDKYTMAISSVFFENLIKEWEKFLSSKNV